MKPIQSQSEPPPWSETRRHPFTFAAIASKNLIRGELITFYVDAVGKITSDKLDMIDPPRLAETKPVS